MFNMPVSDRVPGLRFLSTPAKSQKNSIMNPEIHTKIDQLVKDNKVFVFMKGSKLMPQCGFSNNMVQILSTLGVPFETFDVLSDPDVRQGIKEYSNWPTIPQLYVDGQFIGGSDIAIELYNNGELQQMLTVALAS